MSQVIDIPNFTFKCCTDESAPPATAGAMAVVKMNPDAVERMVSIKAAEPAIYLVHKTVRGMR